MNIILRPFFSIQDVNFLSKINSQVIWNSLFNTLIWKVHLLNLLASIFRPSFFVFWLRELKIGMYASFLMFSKDLRSILGFRSSGPEYWGRPRGPLSPKLKLAILDNIGHVGTLFGAAWVTNHEFDTEKIFGVPPDPQGHPRESPRGDP